MFLFIFLSNKLYKFIKKNKNNYSFYNKMNWGLGIGDWGLGIGDWGLGPKIGRAHV